MNNGYNPEQFDTEETVGDINQLLSNGRGIVNAGRSFVGGARSAINSGKSSLNKLKKNDEKDVEAINNRQKNNDGVNRRPRNKDDDENNNKDKKTSEESKTQSSNGKQSALEDKNKLDDSKKSKNNNDDKSKINDKVDKSKKDDGLKKGLGNKTDDKKKKKLKPNKKENLEVELAKKVKKIKAILMVLKVAGMIAFPIIVIVLIVLVITAAIKWAEEHLWIFADLVVPDDLKYDIGDYHSDSSYIGNYGSSSSFIINGKEYSGKIKVRLYKNDSFELVYSDDRLIDFDKYILGVAYQEVGGGTDSVSEQVFKTQAIAARSYALTRGIGMPEELKLTEENGYIVVNIRQTTSDQAYCDPDLGYYAGQLNNCSSGHPKLSADSPLRKWAQEVEGLVLVDSKGNIVNTPYFNVDQNKWRSMANNGMKYDEILIKHYDSANNGYTIKRINSAVSNTEAENWKQCDSRWGALTVRKQTICQIGCALTSVSIQIARSGTPTKVSGEFNPGTFMKAHRSNGGFSTNDSITWNVTGVAPGFKLISSSYLSGTKEEKIRDIGNKISNNEYVVLGVRYSVGGDIGHYVAVNYVDSGEIYTFDPNSSKKGQLFVDYPAMKESSVKFQVLRYKLEE